MVDTIISSMMFEIKISNIMEKLFYLYKIIENFIFDYIKEYRI